MKTPGPLLHQDPGIRRKVKNVCDRIKGRTLRIVGDIKGNGVSCNVGVGGKAEGITPEIQLGRDLVSVSPNEGWALVKERCGTTKMGIPIHIKLCTLDLQ